jgi:intergrase/recombinase
LKPQELRAITLKDKEYRGLRALFNYCEEEEIDEVAGYSIEKWRRYIKIKPSGVVEIYVTDDEMREAYSACAVDLKPFFELLTYSGSRFSHVYEMLDHFDERNILVNGEVAHYPTSGLSKGTKRTFHIFFPASFIPTLKNMGTNKSYKTLTKDLQYGRVSAKTIRKWHLNLMVAAGISESLADFIQGRSATTVGSAHYLNKVQQSREAYRRLVSAFDSILQGTSRPAPCPCT